jgi:hypothetical protein
MTSIREQFRANSVALISIAIAIVALGYNTWRNETTETQRNVRHAAFRMLESLGELQEIVDTRYYYLPFETAHVSEGASRIRGFGTVTMVRDLTGVMPDPAGKAGAELHDLWLQHFLVLHRLDENGEHTAAATQAEQNLTGAIRETRAAVLEVLSRLD